MFGLGNVLIYSSCMINSYKKEDFQISVLCRAKIGAAS